MSTRSNIAIEDPKTKKVKVIYVHSDGYPYGVGKILNDNYTTYQKAKKLFNYGDASFLSDTIDECSSIPEIGTEKKIKPESTGTSGCT